MDEISNFREVLRRKLDSHSSEGELKKEIFQLLSAVDQMEPETLGCRSLRSFWQESEGTQAMSDGLQYQPIKSGFGSLDLLCGGFYPGELVILGGRPSMGKTQFLVNMALNMAAERGILFYSFDLSPFLLSNRFVSAAARIPSRTVTFASFES
jgi:replicative DNA helicase